MLDEIDKKFEEIKKFSNGHESLKTGSAKEYH